MLCCCAKVAHNLTKAELKGYKGSEEDSESLMEKLSKALQSNARLKEKVKEQKKRIVRAEDAAAHNQAMFLAKLEMDAAKIDAFLPTKKEESSDED